MKKTLLSVLMVLAFLSGSVFAKNLASETKNVTDKQHDGFLQLASVSVDLMPYGIMTPGAGLSANYEKYLGYHMAASGVGGGGFYFGKWTSFDELMLLASAGMNIRFYPLHDSLRGLYVGNGVGADWLFYFGPDTIPEGTPNVFGYVKPEIGWKFYILKHFMIDLNASYKWETNFTKDLPAVYKRNLDDGFHFGVGFKFFWAK